MLNFYKNPFLYRIFLIFSSTRFIALIWLLISKRCSNSRFPQLSNLLLKKQLPKIESIPPACKDSGISYSLESAAPQPIVFNIALTIFSAWSPLNEKQFFINLLSTFENLLLSISYWSTCDSHFLRKQKN